MVEKRRKSLLVNFSRKNIKMNTSNKNILIIFTRNPELGNVKTRLAKKVGNQTALEIYTFLLEKTKEITTNITADKAVYYSVKIKEQDLWDAATYQKHQQVGSDLGIRMKNAFKNSFSAGYKKVLIIGSDLYDLTTENIENAFLELDKNDVVLGPAEDGGYYLLGMKTLQEAVFENKKWGTSSVRKDTLADLKDKKVSLLTPLNDVDVFEDIEHHKAFQHFFK